MNAAYNLAEVSELGDDEKRDPSENVLRLVSNAEKRSDDLREAGFRYIEDKIDDHFENIKKMVEAETKRIDALRMVDVQAVGLANERAIKQAEVLAAQVSTSAEALRALVATTAVNVAQSLDRVSSQLIERIAAVEKAQSESKGRSGLSTPLLMVLSGIAFGIIVKIYDAFIAR